MKYIILLAMLAFTGCATIECVERDGKTTCEKAKTLERVTEKREAGRLGRQ